MATDKSDHTHPVRAGGSKVQRAGTTGTGTATPPGWPWVAVIVAPWLLGWFDWHGPWFLLLALIAATMGAWASFMPVYRRTAIHQQYRETTASGTAGQPPRKPSRKPTNPAGASIRVYPFRRFSYALLRLADASSGIEGNWSDNRIFLFRQATSAMHLPSLQKSALTLTKLAMLHLYHVSVQMYPLSHTFEVNDSDQVIHSKCHDEPYSYGRWLDWVKKRLPKGNVLTALEELGAMQWGLVTTGQAKRIGIEERLWLSRLMDRGIIHRIRHGVYALPSETLWPLPRVAGSLVDH